MGKLLKENKEMTVVNLGKCNNQAMLLGKSAFFLILCRWYVSRQGSYALSMHYT